MKNKFIILLSFFAFSFSLAGIVVATSLDICLQQQANSWSSVLLFFLYLKWAMILALILSIFSIILFLINRKKKWGGLWKKIFLVCLIFFVLTILMILLSATKGFLALNPYKCNQINNNQIAPEDVPLYTAFEYYKLALKSGDKNKYLESITEESRNMVNFSPALMQKEYQDIKDLVFDVYADTKTSAMVRFIPTNLKVPPYFMKKENGQWKIDLKRMGETYIFDQNNNWSYK